MISKTRFVKNINIEITAGRNISQSINRIGTKRSWLVLLLIQTYYRIPYVFNTVSIHLSDKKNSYA